MSSPRLTVSSLARKAINLINSGWCPTVPSGAIDADGNEVNAWDHLSAVAWTLDGAIRANAFCHEDDKVVIKLFGKIRAQNRKGPNELNTSKEAVISILTKAIEDGVYDGC